MSHLKTTSYLYMLTYFIQLNTITYNESLLKNIFLKVYFNFNLKKKSAPLLVVKINKKEEERTRKN